MIRVFVGCSPNGMDAESQAVLEWSIRKLASEPVEIEWMILSLDPQSPWYSDGDNGWQTKRWATPFSGFRWAIPDRCGNRGKAIYMDSDVIVMADLAQLWHQKIKPGKVALAKGGGSWRYCVSLWDCKEAAKHLLPIYRLKTKPDAHLSTVSYFAGMPHLTQEFAGDWNCLDGMGHLDLKDGKMKALHYTDMSTQPHLKHAIPRLFREGGKHWFNGTVKKHPRKDVQQLFDDLLLEAEENGYKVENYCNGPSYGAIQKADLKSYHGARA